MADVFKKVKKLAEEKAMKLYGENLPKIVKERLDWELGCIENGGYAKRFLLAYEIVREAERLGYTTIAKSITASSFVLFLLGATNTNPLSAHYLCSECCCSEFHTEKMCGVDLENKTCPICGKELNKEGFTLPVEFFTGVEGKKSPQITFSVPLEVYEVLLKNPDIAAETDIEQKLVVIDKLPVVSMLTELKELTKIECKDIPLDNEATFTLLKSGKVWGIPFLNSRFSKNVIEMTGLESFDDLIRISALMHGTETLSPNTVAWDLLENKSVQLNEIISTREDVMQRLIACGASRNEAFEIAEKVRKGLFAYYKLDIMSDYNVPDWFVKSCREIMYLYPRAHAAELARLTYYIAYYKTYYPLQFYCAYLKFNKDKVIYDMFCRDRHYLEETKDALDRFFEENEYLSDDAYQETLDRLFAENRMAETCLEMMENSVEVVIDRTKNIPFKDFVIKEEKIFAVYED